MSFAAQNFSLSGTAHRFGIEFLILRPLNYYSNYSIKHISGSVSRWDTAVY